MPAIEVKNISKSFGSNRAVDGVSFDVQPGEVFALLGPNGAGKTTIIRTILDIFHPDAGQISVLGSKMNEEKKNLIGYLPEERGLYQEITLERCLTFLASLKGMQPEIIKNRLNDYLEKFELSAYRKKKVKELSKGMQQKAQLITTLIHEPRIILADEPFSALDPVNTELLKHMLLELRDQGKAVVLSTHQMSQVEELCDRIVLVDRGQVVLYGSLEEIRDHYTGNAVLVRPQGPLPQLAGVTTTSPQNGNFRLELAPGVTPQAILQQLVAQDVTLEQFEIAVPTLDEIFIKVVTSGGESE